MSTPAPPQATPATQEHADAALAMACLDLTELGDHCSAADIDSLCQRAPGWPGRLPAVAAVCVWPRWVAHARAALPSHVAVAAVVNFPSGDQPLATTLAEVALLRAGGASEVDMVFPHRRWRAGDHAGALADLRAVRAACADLRLKVILESGVWDDVADLRRACDAALDAGADFLKTSTGKLPQGASLGAAQLMLDAVATRTDAARLGIKPSGGLRTLADVQPYLALVRSAHSEWGLDPARFRIGASALWADLASHLGHTPGVANAAIPPSY